jgi:hypothetical protein
MNHPVGPNPLPDRNTTTARHERRRRAPEEIVHLVAISRSRGRLGNLEWPECRRPLPPLEESVQADGRSVEKVAGRSEWVGPDSLLDRPNDRSSGVAGVIGSFATRTSAFSSSEKMRSVAADVSPIRFAIAYRSPRLERSRFVNLLLPAGTRGPHQTLVILFRIRDRVVLGVGKRQPRGEPGRLLDEWH